MSYSPTLQRWMETDPEEYIDGPNLYQMERSSPVTLLDPLGMDAQAIPTGPDGKPIPDPTNPINTPGGPVVYDPYPIDSGRVPGELFPQLRWGVTIPAGIVHYDFRWQVTRAGKDVTDNREHPGLGELAQGGHAEAWFVSSAQDAWEIASIAIGDTGSGFQDKPIPIAGVPTPFPRKKGPPRWDWIKRFMAERFSPCTEGTFDLLVDVRAARAGEIGSRNNEFPSGHNNVNRIWHGGLGALPIFNNNQGPADWGQRAVLATFRLSGHWTSDGKLTVSWEDSQMGIRERATGTFTVPGRVP